MKAPELIFPLDQVFFHFSGRDEGYQGMGDPPGGGCTSG
jgi:hypothetical protein